jgi:two-component system LytT family response regulator
MNKIRTIIIEDEPQAREMLATLLTDYCENIHVIGEASNVTDGVSLIKKLLPDLVFLDIEMPRERGLNLFKYFDKIEFETIFTTAYEQYAIEALRLSALDYLLKPIDLEELRLALQKFRAQQQQKIMDSALRYQLLSSNQVSKKVVLPSKDSYTFLNIDDIMYCQAENSYTLFVTNTNEKHWVSKPIKDYSATLHNMGFIRVHRSAIVNPKYVKKLIRTRPSSVIMEDGAKIGISKLKRDDLIDQLTNN